MYITGPAIVAVSTGACAFAQTYWQLLLFRSLGGLGSAMFTVSSLGLMIRIRPDARGRVAGMFSSAFLVGSVGGPVLGSLTVGLGLPMPFVIYGVALLIAAAVVFIRLRHSPLPRARSTPSRSSRCGGAAQPRLPRRAVLELRDRMVGVRSAHRAGAVVRRRGARPQRRDGRPGAGHVRHRQRLGRDSAAVTCPTGSADACC